MVNLFLSLTFYIHHAFDLVYMDLWISPIVTTFGAKYCLLIVDDFTHFMGIISLY